MGELLCPILKAQFPCAVYFSSCYPQIPLQKLLFSATLTQDPEKLQQLNLFQPRLFTSVYSEKKSLGEGTETEQDTKYTLPEGLSVGMTLILLYKLCLKICLTLDYLVLVLPYKKICLPYNSLRYRGARQSGFGSIYYP